MKENPQLKSLSFLRALKGFAEWLLILNYADETVAGLPIQVCEFLSWLEAKGITDLRDIQNLLIREFYNEQKSRPNKRRGGGLSGSYLKKYAQAIGRFCDYLRQTRSIPLAAPDILLHDCKPEPIVYLSVEQMKELYRLTVDANAGLYMEGFNRRDRAMLTLLYACGLRRNEAYFVNVKDVNFDRKTLHVRHGKGKRERMLPLHQSSLDYFEDYIYTDRDLLTNDKREPALLINWAGNRLGGIGIAQRLLTIQKRSDDPAFLSLRISPHILRHSIATHLLQNGMKLEQIARFLGHKSLESTQIYTHLERRDD